MPKRKKTQSKRERMRERRAVEAMPDIKIIDSVQMKPAAPNHLVEAVREELIRLVEMPNHESNLGQIARFARAADDMLIIVKAPEAVMRDEHAILGATAVTPAVAANGAETYGASILRQLIPALQSYQKAQYETPEALVHAITLARRNGMTDVAAELEKKLTGKPLDGERPVKSDVFTVDLPALTSAPHDGPKPEEKKNGKSTS